MKFFMLLVLIFVTLFDGLYAAQRGYHLREIFDQDEYDETVWQEQLEAYLEQLELDQQEQDEQDALCVALDELDELSNDLYDWIEYFDEFGEFEEDSWLAVKIGWQDFLKRCRAFASAHYLKWPRNKEIADRYEEFEERLDGFITLCGYAEEAK